MVKTGRPLGDRPLVSTIAAGRRKVLMPAMGHKGPDNETGIRDNRHAVQALSGVG